MLNKGNFTCSFVGLKGGMCGGLFVRNVFHPCVRVNNIQYHGAISHYGKHIEEWSVLHYMVRKTTGHLPVLFQL